LNDFSAHHLRLQIGDDVQDTNEDRSADGSETLQVSDHNGDIALTVKLVPLEDATTPVVDLQPYSTALKVFYAPSLIPSTSTTSSPIATFIANELSNLFTEEQATLSHILSSSGGTGKSQQSIPADLANSIARRKTRSLKYAETYHITFSLFSPTSTPSSWDIESALQEYVEPLLSAFSSISNFSIDSQVQLYATFSPSFQQPEYSPDHQAWTLRQEDLSGFINAAEWPLSPSIGSGPTINFVLYVPSATQSPLVVKENGSPSWLIPQWGGVMILNPPTPSEATPNHLPKESLHLAFQTFSHQLLSLLGTPQTPHSLPLRLQTLTRIQALSLLLSASSTMGSLARLTLSLPSIPIPKTVAASVSRSISHLSATCSHLLDGRFQSALENARIAEFEAERGFFEKSMVGQVYFPDEHKIAVYLPLLGPVGVPLVMAVVKEGRRLMWEWRRRRGGG
jgi:GPI-anchor transamidase subunit S